ncbi:MAG: helix-turn-helix domain-containing protein [Patescibacteria group bacterium]
MIKEIKPGGVYTTTETRELLRISDSTIKRLLKGGLIRANKIGGQYRILGHEILRLLSPDIDRRATNSYQKLKRNVARTVKYW